MVRQRAKHLEKAACQFANLLTEVEFVAGDFPSRWVYKIAPDFFEVKNFLAMQMVDEARHMEVFRKRALAGGGGLLHASPASEWALKAILSRPPIPRARSSSTSAGDGPVDVQGR